MREFRIYCDGRATHPRRLLATLRDSRQVDFDAEVAEKGLRDHEELARKLLGDRAGEPRTPVEMADFIFRARLSATKISYKSSHTRLSSVGRYDKIEFHGLEVNRVRRGREFRFCCITCLSQHRIKGPTAMSEQQIEVVIASLANQDAYAFELTRCVVIRDES